MSPLFWTMAALLTLWLVLTSNNDDDNLRPA